VEFAHTQLELLQIRARRTELIAKIEIGQDERRSCVAWWRWIAMNDTPAPGGGGRRIVLMGDSRTAFERRPECEIGRNPLFARTNPI
jgi:hypothetical protein